MSVYGSSSTWGGQCSATNQSPINLSQSSAKPCDSLCDLVFDDAYISQANLMISDEGLILQSTSGLGSCKFNGEGYTCNNLVVTHPSHHNIESIAADGEVVAIFTSSSGKLLCVSSLFRVNPHQTTSTQFFNAFIPYANPSVPSTTVNLGDNWGLFMMVPPMGSFYAYEGSLIVPPCSSCNWVVFKAMINIDSNEFAFLVKNVNPGSRPIQSIGSREIYLNDQEQLPGGPMPHDNKTYMRCKRTAKKGEDTKPAKQAPLGSTTPQNQGASWSNPASWFTNASSDDMDYVYDTVFYLASLGIAFAIVRYGILHTGAGAEAIYYSKFAGPYMWKAISFVFTFLWKYIVVPVWNFLVWVPTTLWHMISSSSKKSDDALQAAERILSQNKPSSASTP